MEHHEEIFQRAIGQVITVTLVRIQESGCISNCIVDLELHVADSARRCPVVQAKRCHKHVFLACVGPCAEQGAAGFGEHVHNLCRSYLELSAPNCRVVL